MNNKKMKRWTRGEVKFAITNILCERHELKDAADLARKIYTDVVARAFEEERKHWEELNRAKESDSFN